MTAPDVFYNEIDDYACRWLGNLIDHGHIARGVVDSRSIEDIAPDELRAYRQCHFFAGIGVWSHALWLAGWPDDRPVWTGSCPCQPFSVAGKGLGFADERHLWPAWHWLIEQCRPAVVFGEQVGGARGLAWLDFVLSDMEGSGYAIGALDLASASLGAPIGGQRLYFVAEANSGRFTGYSEQDERAQEQFKASRRRDTFRRCSDAYAAEEYVVGHDGAMRKIEPGIQPLVDGYPGALECLRAYGNAIVAPQAAEFIRAAMSCQP